MDEARRSAERDLEQAREALERGEMHQAADHLAGAIAHAPTDPATHELLGRLAERTGGALELFPIEQHAFVGTVVARAHLLAAAGRPEDGLPLLVAASGHTPDVEWAGVPWVRDPELAARVEPGLLAHIVMQLCTAIGDPAPESGRAALQPYLTLVRHAVDAHAEHAMLLGAASALARRLEEPAQAVDWALRGARLRPSKLAEIWLGYAYRSAGRIPECLAALRRAVMYDPDDLSLYADIAGTLADADRLEDALNWIDRALSKDPAFECAVHTGHRLRYHADGDLAHLVRLADFQRDHPDDTHEHTDLADCCADQPWLSRVPSAPELPLDPARTPFPAALTPSAESVERLHRVAHPLWPHPPAAYDAALSLMLVEPRDLLALIVRPPDAPDDETGRALATHSPALWAQCARVWACLGLLHHGADEPWAGSKRRRLLVSLATDGLDRIAEAALSALVTYAWVDPQARPDVAALLASRLEDAAGTPGLAWSVAHLVLATPDVRPEIRQRAAEVARAEEIYAISLIPRQRTGRGARLRRWFSGG
ncbi:tetratricopeptide repeat protein [Actinoplanes sp. TFC3]|uniref:tetratricopeptide repeat protein n=1 Tax=Actinoplanes sp. TFC3 TaxID=1710355 RepID=UPI000833CD07|nr:tetratricopeptide repeat protein [Actinoplanes sp. TFC3]